MTETEAILKNRDIVNGLGQRDSTYAMLMQLEMPECLRTLEQMATTRIGCWRDVRAFIRHFERNAPNHHASDALIQGCVRMTNAQLRKDVHIASASATSAYKGSLAAKWVPREPKCRGSPLMMWYYDALAHDMFPGAPDAKRRYRQLISRLSPPVSTKPVSLSWFVKQAEMAQTNETAAQEINAQWQAHLTRHRTMRVIPTIPVLSLAHTMGPGHNNCLHAGIGLALHVAALSCNRIITFSSQAEWHVLEDDFVKQAQHLLRTARSAVNGLNANLESVASSVATLAFPATMLVIGDMEHDDPPLPPSFNCVTWNVSRNGRPATFHGETPHDPAYETRHTSELEFVLEQAPPPPLPPPPPPLWCLAASFVSPRSTV